MANSTAIDPLNNPYFGTASGIRGDTSSGGSLGSGNGWGFYDWTGVPGAESFITGGGGSGDSYQDQGIDPQALTNWLSQNGYSLREAVQGEEAIRYLQDANGNIIGAPQSYSLEDEKFWTGALLASAVTGSAIAGWAGAGAGASETAALGSAEKAALYGSQGYGAGMTGAEVAAYDAALAGGTSSAAGGSGGYLGSWGGWGADFGELGSMLTTTTAGTGGASGGTASTSGLSPRGSALVKGGAGLASTYMQGQAAQDAAAAQQAAAQAGQTQAQQMYAQLMQSLQPYLSDGTSALTAQGNLLGLNGNPAQQTAINELQASPQFTSALKLGENRILANASATGGLRGGNTQAALAQFSPQLLSATINDQLTRLSGVTGQGLSATGMGGTAGQNTSSLVAQLLQTGGAAAAGGALAQGQTNAGYVNALMGAIGYFTGGGF
jgi:hypothetical protein